MTTIPPTLQTAALPTFTTLLGLLSLGGGIYNFANPAAGATGFGLTPPNITSTSPFETAYIRVHGIRNIAGGLTNLALISFWQFSGFCRDNPAAAAAVRRCLGLSLTIGTVVGLGDAWIVGRYAKDVEEGEVKETAKGKSMGHAGMAVVIAGVGLGMLLG